MPAFPAFSINGLCKVWSFGFCLRKSPTPVQIICSQLKGQSYKDGINGLASTASPPQTPHPNPARAVRCHPSSAVRKKVTQSVQKRQHDKAPMKKQTVTPIPLSKQRPGSAPTTENSKTTEQDVRKSWGCSITRDAREGTTIGQSWQAKLSVNAGALLLPPCREG